MAFEGFGWLAKATLGLTLYGSLALFLLASFGAGWLLIGRSAIGQMPRAESSLLALVAGVGVIIVLLFLLGLAAMLTRLPVALMLLALIAVGSARLMKMRKAWIRKRPVHSASDAGRWLVRHWFKLALGIIVAATFLLRPLQAPLGWDELSNHLPYARLWAEQGRLSVDPWLRFPLFAYNFNLLYAGSLLFGSDVLPHLIHAAAGSLVALGVYVAGRRWGDRGTALLAAALFLASAAWGFDNAYLDLGLTLFVFYGLFSLALWRDTGAIALLYLAAFLFALAAGTKYQGLFYLPIFGLLVLARERRGRPLLAVVGIVIVFGGYWYLRNYLISGNPVHPLGSRYFGYWLWDQGDIDGAIADVHRREWPMWYMLPAALGVLLLPRSTSVFKGLAFAAYAALAVWWVTGPIERYLMPAYPLLGLLTACVIVRNPLSGAITGRLREFLVARPNIIVVAQFAVTCAAAFIVAPAVSEYWTRITPDQASRDRYLRERLSAYAIFESLRTEPGWRLYQFGFEGQIYYSPVPVIGDWFGPARYRAIYDLADRPAALASHLRSLGANGFLVNAAAPMYGKVKFGAEFPQYFELVRQTPQAKLYRLRP